MFADITMPPARLRQSFFGLNSDPVRHKLGVWEFLHFNARSVVLEKLRDPADDLDDLLRAAPGMKECIAVRRAEVDRMQEMYQREFSKDYKELNSLGFYGVCDDYHQVLERFPHFAADTERRYVLTFCRATKRGRLAVAQVGRIHR